MRDSLLLCCVLSVYLLSGFSASAATSDGVLLPRTPEQTEFARSSIRGTVLDPSGAPIVAARVSATRISASGSASSLTNQRGEFALSVDPGNYTINVVANGFVDLSQRISTADTNVASLKFVMQMAGVRETVSVTANADYRVPSLNSATKTPTPLDDLPQSISVVTRQLISDQAMQSMADVVRYTPGIGMAQGEGNRDAPIFRGNSSTSDFYVDGVRDDMQYFRDLYNVERIEALKGPNAMIFGRGGIGGVINKVTRQANWGTSRDVVAQLGSWNDRRLTADVGTGLNESVAARITGVYERSDSYREGVGLERYGVNPTVAFAVGPNTTLRAGYEYFRDVRTADRGISSFAGRPVSTAAATFFGNPDLSTSDATVNVFASTIEHRFSGGAILRNRVSYGGYSKFYQNVFPGAVNAAGTTVSISAYNNATERGNFFNQADLILAARTGRITHTLMVGSELGRQVTDNFRMTGFFSTIGPTITSVSLPLENPTTTLPVEFRQNGSDADNHGVATVAAVYAQDQLTLTSRLQAVLGVRLDSFNVDFRDNRTGTDLSSDDTLLSPRAGLIFKPSHTISFYGSYGLTHLPRAGEQLASLSLTNRALDPEEFRNYEVGARWHIAPGLTLTGAMYRLKRGNVATPDPVDPRRSILLDAQRTEGLELEVVGKLSRAWTIAGGYAYQDGRITQSISESALAGAALAQLPKNSFSIWNRYDLSSRWAVGIGTIRRGAVFTSTDNTVVLPGFTRVDGALFVRINTHIRAQMNVENLFDTKYFPSAHSNTNITPGAPRAVRVSLSTRF